MASFLNEIRSSFNKGDSMLRKLILINLAFFIGITLVRVSAFLATGERDMGDKIVSWIYLSSSFNSLLVRPWSIITYMFSHQGIWHIVMNLLWLYMLGRIFEEYLGNVKLLKVYLLGGIAGGVLYLLGMNFIPVFRGALVYLHGASAGVTAVVVGSATLLPNYELRIFVWDIKLKYIALFMVLLSVLQMTGANPGGNMAHLGGGLAGFLYVRNLQKRTFFDRIEEQFSIFFDKLFRRKKDERRIHRPSGPARVKPNQEQIDAILDKISRSGYDSLTKAERETLFQASRDDNR